MVNSDSEQGHPTRDEALSQLTMVPGAIGNFVKIYPGFQASDETDWLETWFRERIGKYFHETYSTADEIQTPESPPAPTDEELLAKPIRLISIQPHYLRGFRNTPEPIRLEGDLVVLDGRNTSGKTSLAEAIEWLFTGCLSRRESMELGSPHELENCISNQFRPDNDETWVSATFAALVSDELGTFTLRRVLREDYGNTSTSRCTSVLFLNDNELTAQDEIKLLDTLFASEPPLLMQHTLRLFVENTPKKRRGYFERLLHLDELTKLIGKAVIGEARLAEFPSPTNSIALKVWSTLGSIAQVESSQRTYKQVSRSEESDLHARLTRALTTIAKSEFSEFVSELNQLEEMGAVLTGEQSTYRQKTYPLLPQMRPPKQISDDQYQPSYNLEELQKSITKFREAWRSLEVAQEAAKLIGDDKLIISRALKILLDGDIIQGEVETQICPICAYGEANTLAESRIKEIESWIPTQEAKAKALETLKQSKRPLVETVQKAIQEYNELLPILPSAKDIGESLKEADVELEKSVQALQAIAEENNHAFKSVISQTKELLSKTAVVPGSSEDCEETIAQCLQIIKGFENLPAAARHYRDAFRAVETAVGAAASINPAYRLRAAWLDCFENIAAIVGDLRWEQAKRRAKKDLETIRVLLMEYRKQFLESRRVSFSQGIDSVWKTLRADRYSSFSKLHIPPPSGRGFPVEIEIKATLDDGQQQKEVDALNVFSESQVNALGIAAFITRSKLLGHKILIFDDPVQSMDDEHFKTFAQDVLTHVLAEGFQVIILTHNDKFARDISLCHYDRPGYVTMSVRLSRRQGCVIEEGNRRFSERLNLAEKQIDEGHMKRAWELLREAIERLYIVVYKKYGSAEFNPESWQKQTADYMWDQGAGNIINSSIPGAGEELKNILDMTAAGGHDIPPRGETDLRKSIEFLKSLPSNLRVGG